MSRYYEKSHTNLSIGSDVFQYHIIYMHISQYNCKSINNFQLFIFIQKEYDCDTTDVLKPKFRRI